MTPITKTRLKEFFVGHPLLESVLVVEGNIFDNKDDAVNYCNTNPRPHRHTIYEYWKDEVDSLAETSTIANDESLWPDEPEPNEPELNGEPS